MERSLSKIVIAAIARSGRKIARFLCAEFLHDLHKNQVDLVKDSSGLDVLILREPQGAEATVYLYGGQVVSWKNLRGEELLFLSSKATFHPPKAIRGGIQICFPQFSDLGLLNQHHGLARCRYWGIDPSPPPPPANGIKSFVDLLLQPSDDDGKIWPHSFQLRLRVTLGAASLMLISRVRNIDSQPISFTFAMQTYINVSDISDVRVEGLEMVEYMNKKGERFMEQGDAITVDTEIDRLYLSSPTDIAVIDHHRRRTFVIRKEGLPDAALWNPWHKKSERITDLDDEDYTRMLCIGSAVGERPIVLHPGEEWQGLQEILVVSSSFCSGQLESLIDRI